MGRKRGSSTSTLIELSGDWEARRGDDAGPANTDGAAGGERVAVPGVTRVPRTGATVVWYRTVAAVPQGAPTRSLAIAVGAPPLYGFDVYAGDVALGGRGSHDPAYRLAVPDIAVLDMARARSSPECRSSSPA